MRHMRGIRNKLRRDRHLGADVAKLRCDGKHEFLVLPDRLFGVASQVGGLLGLELHVGVGDFGDRGEVKDDGEEEDETGDGEVGPLDVGLRGEEVSWENTWAGCGQEGRSTYEGTWVGSVDVEEGVGGDDGGDYGADGLEALSSL